MNKFTLIVIFIFLLPSITFSQASNPYPENVEVVLKKSGKNRIELENAINHFISGGDSLKIKSIFFLIANMEIHYSADYYWADSTGKKIAYNELDYADYSQASSALEKIKAEKGKLKAIAYTYKDIDTVKASFLIDNVEQAFLAWKKPYAENLSFSDFCEYLLPYRISVEPLQDWRTTYLKKFSWIADSALKESLAKILTVVANDLSSWFYNTWGDLLQRSEPLPRLGALQLLSHKKGPCEDIADLQVFTLRSQGIPTTVDFIPFWATSFGGHFVNATLNSQSQPIHFDITRKDSVIIDRLAREPSKVLRITYSKQQNILASQEEFKNIPAGFLRSFNYKDVTNEYWPVKDIKVTIETPDKGKSKAYLCVFNFMNWRPTWWGNVVDSSVTFSSMPKGVVYLPSYYENGKIKPADYPIAVGYNNELVLKPDTINREIVKIKQQEKYLLFRANKKYSLYYYDFGWKKVAEKMAIEGTMELVFEKVPKNSLLILRPEYSMGRERPFIITKDGERIWF